jgi:glycosyltransferase involved in cell wall biosynthesis
MKPSSGLPEDERKLRIVGLIQGDVNDLLSRAGVNYRLYKELGRTASVIKVIDVEPSGLRRYWLALRTFYPNRRKWARRFYENPRIFDARSTLASRQLEQVSEHYDIILQDGAMWLPRRSSLKIPLITYHDSNVILGSNGGPLAQGSHYKGRKLRQAVALEKKVYNTASRVLTFSEWVRKSMIRDFQLPEDKVRVARPGVNFEIPEDWEKQYDEPIILFVGRNFERKGGPALLKAFRLAREQIPNARLVIVGCSPTVNEAGITVKGLIPREREHEIKELYKTASVFALPSLFEPFGLVFLEAMAHKLPCVGANICAMPEIIGHGECGFLAHPDDDKTLADILITLLKNPELMRRMGARGYQKVKAEYTWEKFARTVISNACELLGGAPADELSAHKRGAGGS